MTNRDRFTAQAKDTVGYMEAENKDSFMIGVSVGISKCENYYETIIKDLTRQRDSYKSSFENTLEDFRKVTSIFRKYEEED